MTLSEFEQFCLRHQEGMFSIAQQVLGNVQSSEDAVLEAMTRMYKTYRQFSFPTETDGRVYALLIAKSVATDYKMRDQYFISGPETASLLQFPTAKSTSLPSDATPGEIAAHFLNSLDDEEKSVLRLHAMGLSYESIAAALDTSPVAVRALIHLARTTLHDRLTEEGMTLE